MQPSVSFDIRRIQIFQIPVGFRIHLVDSIATAKRTKQLWCNEMFIRRGDDSEPISRCVELAPKAGHQPIDI
jgi:hypothetical protein